MALPPVFQVEQVDGVKPQIELPPLVGIPRTGGWLGDPVGMTARIASGMRSLARHVSVGGKSSSRVTVGSRSSTHRLKILDPLARRDLTQPSCAPHARRLER